jgi:hypothetical protein
MINIISVIEKLKEINKWGNAYVLVLWDDYSGRLVPECGVELRSNDSAVYQALNFNLKDGERELDRAIKLIKHKNQERMDKSEKQRQFGIIAAHMHQMNSEGIKCDTLLEYIDKRKEDFFMAERLQ